MEIPEPLEQAAPISLTVRMFGRLAVIRNGKAADLPPSRKVRALLAYLALAPRPVGRSRLCELLGDVPNDPRGELRWCLSKLRTILDEPGRSRISARDDLITLDLGDCVVDALTVDAAMRTGLEMLDIDRLRDLCGLVVGDFLEGLDLSRSPQLDHWLATQRRRYRACHIALLERLIDLLPHDPRDLRPYAEQWVELSPFDPRSQILLLRTLLACGLPNEAEHHLAAIARLFESEKMDIGPIRKAWKEMRSGTVAPATTEAAARQVIVSAEEFAPDPKGVLEGPRRASLAVLPFAAPDSEAAGNRLADGLTHDIITRLAKLRSLFVIARGSVFALTEQGVAPEDAARRLNVDYFASGVLRQLGGKSQVAIELVETRTARIVWSEEFLLGQDEAFLVLDDIGDMIVASIANEIETAERNRAILKPPNSLNAWEAYHRGLWHMYRFTKADNEIAQQFFRQSSEIDPTFARAYAGLSFTHWQNAFQQWANREGETDLAFEAAGRSLMVDDHDPAAHWAMGRALWLRRRPEQAVAELERAVDLSPNFALGHYALSFVQSQSGDPAAAIASSDHSRSLSPFDPLLFGMLGARAMAHVRLGQFDEAADWAIKAAARPNAHIIILAIAAHCLALAGRIEEGKTFAALIRQSKPNFRVDDFLATFTFEADAEILFRKAARRVGLDQ
ncbi:transcriptional regulator [Chelativorans sp. AA-79]|uniref:transcriptional regulator n=1 Tax=Chelativorans sp. AA-79 TaxID=3028735 RepID=UPI0023F99BE8|nr:transcriptional regulator [Chelativorans sp. AA-79]WEX08083.1 transcriptional regulator [Chelativorans sp. AA-79]